MQKRNVRNTIIRKLYSIRNTVCVEGWHGGNKLIKKEDFEFYEIGNSFIIKSNNFEIARYAKYEFEIDKFDKFSTNTWQFVELPQKRVFAYYEYYATVNSIKVEIQEEYIKELIRDTILEIGESWKCIKTL